jgi:hypothetical protein
MLSVGPEVDNGNSGPMVKPMTPHRVASKILILVFILAGLVGPLAATQNKEEPQLPKELKDAKVYRWIEFMGYKGKVQGEGSRARA